eukprot:297122_1
MNNIKYRNSNRSTVSIPLSPNPDEDELFIISSEIPSVTTGALIKDVGCIPLPQKADISPVPPNSLYTHSSDEDTNINNNHRYHQQTNNMMKENDKRMPKLIPSSSDFDHDASRNEEEEEEEEDDDDD